MNNKNWIINVSFYFIYLIFLDEWWWGDVKKGRKPIIAKSWDFHHIFFFDDLIIVNWIKKSNKCESMGLYILRVQFVQMWWICYVHPCYYVFIKMFDYWFLFYISFYFKNHIKPLKKFKEIHNDVHIVRLYVQRKLIYYTLNINTPYSIITIFSYFLSFKNKFQ